MKRLIPLAACILAGCAAQPRMVSHEGLDCTPPQLEHLARKAADRIAETYPAGRTVLYIAPAPEGSRFTSRLEALLRGKGCAIAAIPENADVSMGLQAGTVPGKGRMSYWRIITSDGTAFSLADRTQGSTIGQPAGTNAGRTKEADRTHE